MSGTSVTWIGVYHKHWLNPFTTGNPFLGTKLLGFSMGRGLGAVKGLNSDQFALTPRVQFYNGRVL